MATSPATSSTQESMYSLESMARALVVGLGWGAVMLFVLSAWMRSKYGEAGRIYTIVFAVAGAAAAGMAIWQAFTLWFQKTTPEEKAATLGQQRRLFGLVFIAAGLGAIGLAFVLGIGKRGTGNYGFMFDNLGESVGILLFGLISLAAGYFLNQPSAMEPGTAVRSVAEKAPMLKFIQLVLAVGAITGFAVLAYRNREEQKFMEYLPELFALFFASILFLACFFWLNTAGLDEFGVRLFVLVFGGTLGFIIFCYSLGRVIYWRQDIVFGGILAWQGENAWRFWTCFYLQFAALVLMFGSFNLARADIRTNVYLRRVMYGYDTVVQGLLVFEILIVANIVLYALVPYTFDWTKSRGAYNLSDASKNLISGLKKEANFVILMPPGDPAYRDLRNLLDNCQALSNKLTITYLSPDNDPDGYRVLQRNFSKIQTDNPNAPVRGVLLVNGPMPNPKLKEEEHKTPYAFVSSSKFVKEDFDPRDPKGKRKIQFRGEEEIIKEFKFLVAGEKRKVYILQGNEEADVNAPANQPHVRDLFSDGLVRMGLGSFVEKLNRDNYQVAGLSFNKELGEAKKQETPIIYLKEDSDKKKSIPKDCDTLIVTPTPKPLPPEIVAAVQKYMDDGGRLLLFLDVFTDKDSTKLESSGLEGLMKQYGIEVVDGFPLAVRAGAQRLPASSLHAVGVNSENVLARQFQNRTIMMPDTARVLKSAEGPGGRFRAEPVLELEHRAGLRMTLMENDIKVLKQDLQLHLRLLEQLGPRLSTTPVFVAMAVSETDGGKPRMVVVGDGEFIGNLEMMRAPTINYSFAVSALEWMAERGSIGAQPKESARFELDPTVDTTRMIMLPFWLMILGLMGLGIAIWIVRRR